MQYEENIKTYERLKDNMVHKKQDDKAINMFYNVVFISVAILISRVIMIDNSSPFGIALLLAVLLGDDNRKSIVFGLGVELGYVINMRSLSGGVMYIVIVPTIVFISIILNGYVKHSVKRLFLIFTTVAMILFYNILICRYSVIVSMGSTALQMAAILPVYIILDNGLKSFRKYRTRHLFCNEEIIAMSVFAALVIAGTWGMTAYNIKLVNILGITVVMGIAYVCGTSIATTAGVAMGIIIGMSTSTIFIYASILGLCGLVSGIFRQGGKIITAISAFVVFCIVKLYITNYGVIDQSQILIIEGVISLVLFLVIPEKVYVRLSQEMDIDKKYQACEKDYAEKIKSILTERLDKFSQVLSNMASTLSNLADNDKLDMNSKSSGMVENLANRVCSTCDVCNVCWGREMLTTYKSFQDLLEGAQGGKIIFPQTLEKKCMKKSALIRNTEDVISKFIVGEMWRKRLAEGRELISGQFNNMARSVDEILGEFADDFNEDRDIENKLTAILEKYDIYTENVLAIKNKGGRMAIQISMESCDGSNMCHKKILPLINECADSKMRMRSDGCTINPKTHKCTACFEEMPNLRISTSVARLCKDGQTIFGDSYSYGESIDGKYMMVLSDGMGSGPQAGRESKAVVDLIEKFTEAGFALETAINSVNSIMSLKFSEEEKFSTVDLCSIDLYNGEVEFIKVGAVMSFIKSGNTVDIIKSRSLPIGILDEADIEMHHKNVKNGDMIIMVSDGILECNEKLSGRVDWILDYLCRNDHKPIEELSKDLVAKAKELGNNRVNDDMTIIISKVHNI